MSKKIATRINVVREKHDQAAIVYHLSDPIDSHSIVLVSSVYAFGSGWETFIFPSDRDGNVLKWLELTGSRRAKIYPDALLIELGYSITD